MPDYDSESAEQDRLFNSSRNKNFEISEDKNLNKNSMNFELINKPPNQLESIQSVDYPNGSNSISSDDSDDPVDILHNNNIVLPALKALENKS